MYKYKLVQPTVETIEILYKWKFEEPHHERYTCRPIKPIASLEEFQNTTMDRLGDHGRKHQILVDCIENILLGEIKGFDFNERNHSMEFGYYLPEESRRMGFGKIMIQLFLNESFSDASINLNKIYATTSENNEVSNHLLIKFGFQLDGKNREHYWIENRKYDQNIYSLLKSEWKENMET